MKTVIEMAIEAGIEQVDQDVEEWICFTDELERFAELVRVTEREACAKVADSMDALQDGAIGAAILARGNTCEK